MKEATERIWKVSSSTHVGESWKLLLSFVLFPVTKGGVSGTWDPFHLILTSVCQNYAKIYYLILWRDALLVFGGVFFQSFLPDEEE